MASRPGVIVLGAAVAIGGYALAYHGLGRLHGESFGLIESMIPGFVPPGEKGAGDTAGTGAKSPAPAHKKKPRRGGTL